MSVKSILALTSAKIGLNPDDEGQRKVLLRFLNEAAFELYTQSDMAGSLMEQVFKVNGDQTIALPAYVGELRAVREVSTMIPWNINQLRPRYNQSNWPDFYRNFRLKGRMPLMSSITNESTINIVVPSVETTPITVTITGQTATASRISETVTVNELSVTTKYQFIEVVAVSKSQVTDYDVTLTDADDKVLTVIPNNELQAWYQVVDISTMPWSASSSSSTDHYVEILYKKSLCYLSEDGDEFPAPGYDTIVSNKMMQIWAQEEGKADQALAYDQLTTRSLARKHEEANRATQDVVGFVANPHDMMNPRIRQGRTNGYGGISRYGAS
jgi:hypothetical protein